MNTTCQYRRDNHLCLKCARPLPPGGVSSNCVECRGYYRLKRTTQRLIRKTNNQCADCGAAATNGIYCHNCFTRRKPGQRTGRRERYLRCKMNAICVQCRQQRAVRGDVACIECKLASRLGKAEYYSKFTNGELTTERYLRRKLSMTRQNCRRTGYRCLITIDDLLERWSMQTGCCAVSQLVMSRERGHLQAISIDRIDPDGDYVRQNIQLVCRFINLGKCRHTDAEVIELLCAECQPCGCQPIDAAFLWNITNSIRSNARGNKSRRVKQCSFTCDDIRNIWSRQDGKCAILNVPLLDASGDLRSLSIDRVDSSVDYYPDNIQLVCQFVNLAKGKFSNEAFLDVLRQYRELRQHKELSYVSSGQG
jgi:hypothetical protein